MHTYGSFLATVIPQAFTSLSIMAYGVYGLVGLAGWNPDIIWISLQVLHLILFLISAAMLVIHGYLWIKGSRSFKRGVKDMRGPSKSENGISVFGWKRPVSERQRFWKVLPRWFFSVIFRRIEDVESYTLAATRNIFAMFLLAILVVQSAVLFRGVLYEQYSNRVTVQNLESMATVTFIKELLLYGIVHASSFPSFLTFFH
jgi:hypothetical protein